MTKDDEERSSSIVGALEFDIAAMLAAAMGKNLPANPQESHANRLPDEVVRGLEEEFKKT